MNRGSTSPREELGKAGETWGERSCSLLWVWDPLGGAQDKAPELVSGRKCPCRRHGNPSPFHRSHSEGDLVHGS